MRSLPSPALRAGWAAVACLASSLVAAAQNTPASPRPYALQNVRLSAAEEAPRKTILLRDGRIEAIQDVGASLPPDVWKLDADGLIAVPGFIDAWTTTGCVTPEPVVDQDKPASTEANVRIDMRAANRKGIQPAFRAAEVLELPAEALEAHQKAGFGVVLSAPGGELLAGHSALAALRDAAPRDLVLDDAVFQHAEFRARGGGYPSTLMAYIAQLRQYFWDVEHQRELRARWEAGRPGPRPAYDEELEAGVPLLEGQTTLVCAVESARDVLRWLGLADEFGLRLMFAGGAEAWKAAARLAERDIPLLMTLDWGDEVEDPDAKEEKGEGEGREPRRPGGRRGRGGPDSEASESEAEGAAAEAEEEQAEEPQPEAEEPAGPDYAYEEPLGLRREKRRLWEERRDGALRLREAGVRVLFCTGSGKPDELLAHVRTLTQEGYPREAALDALTVQPAELLGIDRHYGWLKPGHSATLCLWTAHPLDEKAQVAWSFVDGFPTEFEVKAEKEDGGAPDEGVDVTGRWEVSFPDDEEGRTIVLTLSMDESGAVSGRAVTTNPMDGSALHASVEGRVSGDEVRLSMAFAVGTFEVSLELEGDVDEDELSGRSRLSMPGNEEESRFEAARLPDDGGRR